MINPQDYPEHTPEWVLAKFFEAWDKRNWKVMLKHCQLSWMKLSEHADIEKVIQSQFRHKLLNAEILKIEKISEVTRDISVKIYQKNINVKRRIIRKVRLICEIAPMQPSPEGRWGVNPTSMIKARK